MVRKLFALALVIILTLAIAGCVTESGYYSPERSAGAGALGGAATGAALGSIIGVATGSPATGAWVGAAAGGLVGAVGGYLYAEHRNSEIRSQAAAAQSYGYSPARGNVVAIDNATVTPSMAGRGQQVNLGMTYTILTPDNYPVAVTLYREVRMGGSLVGQPYQTQVSNANGTFTDSVAYNTPTNPGTYAVVSRVITNVGSAERVSYFTVQ
jgi:hypothetical protein